MQPNDKIRRKKIWNKNLDWRRFSANFLLCFSNRVTYYIEDGVGDEDDEGGDADDEVDDNDDKCIDDDDDEGDE